jgi:phosphoribosyl-AMP cyclohydrolase
MDAKTPATPLETLVDTPRPSRDEAEAAVRTLIAWAGDDPNRPGVLETPKRVVDAYGEFFRGYEQDAGEILNRVFEETGGYQDIVLMRDIPFYSHCEHHMVPFIGKAHIAYYPGAGLVGIWRRNWLRAGPPCCWRQSIIAWRCEASRRLVSRRLRRPLVESSQPIKQSKTVFWDSCARARFVLQRPPRRADIMTIDQSSVFALPTSHEEIEEGTVLMPAFGPDGLIAAIVTDADSGDVVMLAWMNAEALSKTIATGEGWYWSRSRQELWHKGATSGHVQTVSEMRIDCDQDAVLIKVHTAGTGANCHTGRKSCFYRSVPIGDAATAPLAFTGETPLFDPKKVYGA